MGACHMGEASQPEVYLFAQLLLGIVAALLGCWRANGDL